MTRVVGVAVDPETGDPVSKRLVYATLLPPSAIGFFPPDDDEYDEETITGDDGSWELNLRPTVGTAAYYRLRVWLNATYIVDVPDVDEIVNVLDIAIPPPDPGEPPVDPGPYLMRSELAIPNGIATLGPDGILTASQRPEGGGASGRYTHSQTTAATVWKVNHNLGYYPSAWSLFDDGGLLCAEYSVQHMTVNQLRVSMDEPTAGELHLT